jgi:hypothetical protein
VRDESQGDSVMRWMLSLGLLALAGLAMAQNADDPVTRARESTNATLIEDLRIDDIPGNAEVAVRELALRVRSRSGLCDPASLEAVLDSDDWQQRLFAARALIMVPRHDLSVRGWEVLLENLVTDDRPGNATLALGSIMGGWHHSVPPEIIEQLEWGLVSDDAQRRRCSALALTRVRGYTPERRLFDVLMEQFEVDNTPGNANKALEAMRRVARRAPEEVLTELEGDLHSDSPQRRFFAALVLVESSRWTSSPQLWDVLLEQLRGDDVRDNASEVLRMLRRNRHVMPASVRERLTVMLDAEDPQTRQFAAHILAYDRGVQPTPRLLEVLAERLEVEDYPDTARVARRAFANAEQPWPPTAIETLEAGLESDVFSQSFFAAYLLSTVEEYPVEKQMRLADELIAHLATRLRDRNIERTLEAIGNLGDPPPPFVVERMEHALDSDNHQQSQIAAMWLSQRCREDQYTPTPRLCEVLVEGLHSERWPSHRDGPLVIDGREITLVRRNEVNARRFFLRGFPEEGTEALVAALDSSDPHQALMAAHILGVRGETEHMDRITEILLMNAPSDRQWMNASLAVRGLAGLGASAVPWIRPFAQWEDDQQVGFVVQRARELINQPPSTEWEWRERSLVTRPRR